MHGTERDGAVQLTTMWRVPRREHRKLPGRETHWPCIDAHTVDATKARQQIPVARSFVGDSL